MRINREIITSRANPTVKWMASLADKKGRERYSSFLAEGEKLTLETAVSGIPVSHIAVESSRAEALLPKLELAFSGELYRDTELIILSDSAFEKISTERAPQGVISVVKHLDFFKRMDIIYREEISSWSDEHILTLCSVRDPGNLGAVIRSAVAFGVDRIVLTDDCVDVYNPKTVRSAMGSLFKVKINVVSDLSEFITVFKSLGRRVFAAELRDGAVSLADAELSLSDTVIIGNEGHGIPENISKLCTNSVYLPISDKTESLNASVAASIFMWEQSKNR